MANGFARLNAEILKFVADELEEIPNIAFGDTPIEKLLFGALQAHVRFGGSEYEQVSVVQTPVALAFALRKEDPLTLIVQPQAQLDGWRVDFLVHAWEFGRISGRPQWRRLIVECDRHDFHERTKEQAARDRSRDREWQMRGFGVLRFTGSEIFQNPLACARQISEWGIMGW